MEHGSEEKQCSTKVEQGSMFSCLTRRFEQESNSREEAGETYTELLIRELRNMQIYGGGGLAPVSLDASWYEQHSNKKRKLMERGSYDVFSKLWFGKSASTGLLPFFIIQQIVGSSPNRFQLCMLLQSSMYQRYWVVPVLSVPDLVMVWPSNSVCDTLLLLCVACISLVWPRW